MKGLIKIVHANTNPKKVGVAILTSDKRDFNSKLSEETIMDII